MNYYNEHNPKAVQWLRALIEQGSIPAGDIDERNIQDVTPKDLAGYRQCHFFAGIGGWSLALRLAGISDEHTLWTGSCPCQPFSVAGQGLGEADERHLWPYFRNLIGICRPAIVLGEQVAKKDGFGWLARVRSDMENGGYAFGGADLCSAGVKAPHNRPRLHWIAVDQLANQVVHGGAPLAPWATPNCCDATRGSPETDADKKARGGAYRPIVVRPSRAAIDALADVHSHGCDRPEEPAAFTDSDGKDWRIYHGSSPGFWSRYCIAQCRDGKARRFEPGAFPLVNGFPARMAVITGFGNAINPVLAAEFIQAAFEAMKI